MNVFILAGEPSGDEYGAELMKHMQSKNPAINFYGGNFTLEENRSGSVLMISGLNIQDTGQSKNTIRMPKYASVGTNYNFLFNNTYGDLTLNFSPDRLQGTIYNISGNPQHISNDVLRTSEVADTLSITQDASGKYTEFECLKVIYDNKEESKNEWFIRGQTDNLQRIIFTRLNG